MNSDNHKINMLRDAEIEKIVNDGHNCVNIMETSPIQYIWCEQKYCIQNYSPKNLFLRLYDVLALKIGVRSCT
jgi:hypothetical protein